MSKNNNDQSFPMKREEDYQYTCPGCEVDDLNVIQLRQHIELHIRDDTLDPGKLPILMLPNNMTKDDWVRIVLYFNEQVAGWNELNEGSIRLEIHVDDSIEEYDTDD